MKPATTTTNISFGYIAGIPVTVGVTMYVLSISSVSEVMMVLIYTYIYLFIFVLNNNSRVCIESMNYNIIGA